MIHTNKDFASSVEKLVTELEQSTDAEIVVVATPRSGSYRDVAWLASSVLAFLMLLFMLFSPFRFGTYLIPIDLIVVAGVGGWLVYRSPRAMRLLTPASRRKKQVATEANNAFVEEVVHGTRARTGILVFLSDFEQAVVIVRDLGLDGKIPGAAWNDISTRAESLEDFLEILRAIGKVLASHVPAIEGDNPDEIPNAPRIRR